MMKRWLVAWLWALALGSSFAPAAAETVLPEAGNLAADARMASTQGMPILIEMSRHGCTYCEKVSEGFLKPMISSGDYRGRVVFRQLHVDDRAPLVDFDGRKITPGEFARRYHVGLTPTVLLLDGRGRLLTKPMVGLTTEEFYGAFLDQAIDKAVARLKAQRGV